MSFKQQVGDYSPPLVIFFFSQIYVNFHIFPAVNSILLIILSFLIFLQLHLFSIFQSFIIFFMWYHERRNHCHPIFNHHTSLHFFKREAIHAGIDYELFARLNCRMDSIAYLVWLMFLVFVVFLVHQLNPLWMRPFSMVLDEHV